MSRDPAVNVSSDRELLALARRVLSGERYAVEESQDGVGILLAENRYFVIGVVATATLRELTIAESFAEAVLSERMNAADTGPKRWDAYLVLLTQEKTSDDSETARLLFRINYDTSRVRRIAHSGVSPTLASVRNALTPFVAPVAVDDELIAGDAFASILKALTARDIQRNLAERAVGGFRQGADLDDIL